MLLVGHPNGAAFWLWSRILAMGRVQCLEQFLTVAREREVLTEDVQLLDTVLGDVQCTGLTVWR